MSLTNTHLLLPGGIPACGNTKPGDWGTYMQSHVRCSPCIAGYELNGDQTWRPLDVLRELVHQQDIASRIQQLVTCVLDDAGREEVLALMIDANTNGPAAWAAARRLLAEQQPF